MLVENRFPDAAFWREGPIIVSRSWSSARRCWRALWSLSRRRSEPEALHLASIEFLRGLGQQPMLATYDRRMAEAAASLGISLTVF